METELEHLRRCAEESSKLEHDILDTAEPFMDLPDGVTYDSHQAWAVVKLRLLNYEAFAHDRGEAESWFAVCMRLQGKIRELKERLGESDDYTIEEVEDAD